MIARFFLVLTVWLYCATAFALSSDNEVVLSEIAFPIPDKYLLVNDYLGIFTISKSLEITKKLQALEKHNGTQIVFLSVPSIGKMGDWDYAVKVANKWDIGNNGQANGVLLFVGPNAPLQILRGPGIAGALPDVKVARIYREIIEPQFVKEKYAEGIEAAIDEMIKAAKGEDTAPAFYDYLSATGANFTPMLSAYERLKKSLTQENILIGLLIVFGLAYAAGLFWRHRKQKRIVN